MRQVQLQLALVIAKWHGDNTIQKEKLITMFIVIGLFGGLIGGPIASLADYYAPPERRLWLFLIPEFIGFACIVLLILYGKSKKDKEG